MGAGTGECCYAEEKSRRLFQRAGVYRAGVCRVADRRMRPRKRGQMGKGRRQTRYRGRQRQLSAL